MTEPEPTEADAGLENPSAATRFKKGRSGNPKGRPRGSASVSQLVNRLFDLKVPIRMGEKTRKLPYFVALAHALKSGALNNDPKYVRGLSELMEALGYYSDKPEPEKMGVLVVSSVHPDGDEWLWAVARRDWREKIERQARISAELAKH